MRYRLRSFLLDTDRHELLLDGKPVELEPRPLRLLLHLASRHPSSVSKEELLQALWPEEQVTPASLARAVHAARQVLGSNAKELLETVRGFGYRLAGPLEREESPPPQVLHRTSPRTDPFVGRGPELRALRGLLEETRAGGGRVALLSGEAGIGKTRLAEECAREAGNAGFEVTFGRSREGEGAPALWPWLQILRDLVRAREPERLARDLGPGASQLAELVPAIRERLPKLDRPTSLEPREARFRLFDAVVQFLARAAEVRALLLVLDDLHFADATSLRLLGSAASECTRSRILFLCTHRDVAAPPNEVLEETLAELARLPTGIALHLAGLEARDATALVARLRDEAIPARDVAAVVARTGGNPFFLREIARSPDPMLATPPGVRGFVRQRISALSKPARTVLEVASVLGREFSVPLLGAAMYDARDPIWDALDECELAGFLEPLEDPPHGAFRFAHIIVREALYESLPRRQRAQHHLACGRAIERLHGAESEDHIAGLAFHFEQTAPIDAAAYARSIDLHRAAAAAAARSSAFDAQGTHLRRALSLLRTLPDDAERRRKELQLQVSLAGQLNVVKGATDPEVERALDRARELCQRIGDSPEVVRTTLGLAAFYNNRGRPRAAADLAEQALRIAKHSSEAFPLLAAHYRLGWPLLLLGDLSRALEHLEQATRFYDPAAHGPGPTIGIQDYGLSARYMSAITLGLLGHADRARTLMRRTVALARECDPFNLAMALTADARLHRHLRDHRRVQEAAEEGVSIARSQGFPYFLAVASALRGWALGDSDGLEESRKAIDQLVTGGAMTYACLHGCDLAEMYHEQGRPEDAAIALKSAVAARGETRIADPILERLRGELALYRSDSEAERRFRRASRIANAQGAKWFELQIATRLASLLKGQKRRDEAHALLRAVYDGLTEGFDTADHKDATVLLQDLS